MLINNGFEVAKRISSKLQLPRTKNNNEQLLPFVSKYNRNNPEILTEIIKNLNQLKNNDRIKNISDTFKFIKSKRQPKSL